MANGGGGRQIGAARVLHRRGGWAAVAAVAGVAVRSAPEVSSSTPRTSAQPDVCESLAPATRPRVVVRSSSEISLASFARSALPPNTWPTGDRAPVPGDRQGCDASQTEARHAEARRQSPSAGMWPSFVREQATRAGKRCASYPPTGPLASTAPGTLHDQRRTSPRRSDPRVVSGRVPPYARARQHRLGEARAGRTGVELRVLVRSSTATPTTPAA